MAFQWYGQNACLRVNKDSITIDDTIDSKADLTSVQVTVSSAKGRLLYNVEYKPSECISAITATSSYPSSFSSSSSSSTRRISDPRISHLKNEYRHSRENSTELKTSTPHVGAAASAVAAKFNYHNEHFNRSRTHTRQGSSFSDTITTTSSNDTIISSDQRLSSDSLWDDWIVKFLHKDDDLTNEDASMEDWIFETM